jgi:hypothetical protein
MQRERISRFLNPGRVGVETSAQMPPNDLPRAENSSASQAGEATGEDLVCIGLVGLWAPSWELRICPIPP